MSAAAEHARDEEITPRPFFIRSARPFLAYAKLRTNRIQDATVADNQHIEEQQRDGYTVSTDPARLDLDAIHDYLANQSYWARNRPREMVERSLRNSLCFGLYFGAEQVGLARVISDCATYAYLCDVYVLPEHRGKGLSKWLIGLVVAHPDLQNLRRFALATRDAHGLYARFGFTPLTDPERHMVIKRNMD